MGDGDVRTSETTLVDSPRGQAGAPAPGSDPHAAPAAAMTPDHALDLDEARRAMLFVLFVLGLCAGASVTTLVLGGDPTYRMIHLGGMGVGAAGGAWFAAVARDPAAYRPWHQTVFGHACVLAIASGFPYWGVDSAVLALVPFGAFVFSTGRSFTGSLSIIAHVMAQHVAWSVLVMTGAIADRSVLGPHGLPVRGQVLVLVLVQAIFAGTFAIARRTRRSQEAAVRDLDRAIRDAAQKGALLAEAADELRAVRQAGGRGLYSGHVIGGYQLGALLGRGAMGEVYDAVAPDGGACAVKLLHAHLRDHPSHAQRFVREARLAASLQVPNVVRVLGVSGDGDEVSYLAMEKLLGEDLATVLGRVATLPVGEVAALVREVGAGLAAAHAAGIVHRDLKPGNLFRAEVAGGAVWKILDFGVSKLAEGGGTLTHGHVVGTPAYMAPEQARGEAVDGRADLYALGVIAYRAITGRPAVKGGDVPAMLYEVVYRTPARPSTLVDVPTSIDDVLAIALAKDPAARFPDGAALADALDAAAVGALDAALTARARRLQAQAPWGRELRRERG